MPTDFTLLNGIWTVWQRKPLLTLDASVIGGNTITQYSGWGESQCLMAGLFQAVLPFQWCFFQLQVSRQNNAEECHCDVLLKYVVALIVTCCMRQQFKWLSWPKKR